MALFGALSSAELIYLSILLPRAHCLNYCSFIVCLKDLKINSISILTLFFYFNIELAILGPLPLHKSFRISFLILTKQLAGISIGIVLNLYIKLGRIDILTILSLPTREHEISLHNK